MKFIKIGINFIKDLIAKRYLIYQLTMRDFKSRFVVAWAFLVIYTADINDAYTMVCVFNRPKGRWSDKRDTVCCLFADGLIGVEFLQRVSQCRNCSVPSIQLFSEKSKFQSGDTPYRKDFIINVDPSLRNGSKYRTYPYLQVADKFLLASIFILPHRYDGVASWSELDNGELECVFKGRCSHHKNCVNGRLLVQSDNMACGKDSGEVSHYNET